MPRIPPDKTEKSPIEKQDAWNQYAEGHLIATIVYRNVRLRIRIERVSKEGSNWHFHDKNGLYLCLSTAKLEAVEYSEKIILPAKNEVNPQVAYLESLE